MKKITKTIYIRTKNTYLKIRRLNRKLLLPAIFILSAAVPVIIFQMLDLKASAAIDATLTWKLNENQGTTANDSSGNNNTGTISGATWVEKSLCTEENCLSFDGSNDNISRADDADLDVAAGGSFTIEAWFRHPTQSSGQDILISKFNEAGYKLLMESDGDITCGIDYDSTWTPADSVTSTAATYDDNRWHHVACVKDANTSLTLYIDGVSVGTPDTSLTNSTLANSDPFYVGIDADGSSNAWLGFIDDVNFYNVAGTQSQIEALYNQGATVLGEKNQDSLSNGLVGYWKLDESSGNATDSSGNGTTLTDATTTTSYTAAKFGNGAELNGSSEYFRTADNAPLSITGSLTLAAWIKPDDTVGSQDIIAKWDGSNESYLLAIEGSNLRMYIDSSSNYEATTGTPIVSNVMQHVAGVYDASSQSVILYVNGAEVASATTGTIPGSIGDDAGRTHLAAEDSSSSATNFYDGHIDEARIYNRALSPGEISQLYNWAPGPIGYWDFEENSGTQAIDRSGNENTGTISGGATYTQGKYGKALEFDGTDDTVDTGSNSVPSNSQTGTWMLWFYPTQTPGNDFGQSVLAYDNGGEDANDLMHLIYNSNNAVFFRHRVGSESHPYHINGPGSGANSVPLNTWTHIALVQDGVAPKIYINGELKGTASGGSDLTSWAHTLSGGKNFIINANTGTTYLEGKMDEVKIYDYARTQQQIIEDMNAGHPIGGSPVGSQVGYWKFDEGIGDTAYNSGNGGSTYDGDLSGSGTTCTSGTSTCPAWSNAGKWQKALDFIGSERDYVEVAGLMGSPENITLSVWAKLDSADSSGAEIISIGDYVTIRADQQEDGLTAFYYEGNSSWNEVTTERTMAGDGEWHHYVYVVDDVNNTHVIYLDGEEIASETTSTSISYSGQGSNTFIARHGNSETTFDFDGLIDEVKVYNVALTADQVKVDYNQGKSSVLGALGTESNGTTPSFGIDRSYCPPGDTTSPCAPIGYWNYEEAGGGTAFDRSGNGHDASHSNGASYTTGKIGKAGNYVKASDQYSTVDDDAQLRPGTGDWTWMAWVKTPNANTRGGIIVKYSSGASHGYVLGICNTVSCNSDGQNFFISYSDSVSNYRTTITTSDYIDGGWHHIVAVASQSEDNVTLYIDGKEAAQSRVNDGNWPNITDTTDLRFGDLTGHYLNGQLDEIKIYNYARTPAQIAWDYNQGKPQSHYKFDECSGSTINDSGGTNESGTISIGASGTQTTAGNCETAGSAWGNGATGKRNHSLNFDGTDDNVSISDNDNLDPGTSDFTIAVWVNGNSMANSDCIICKSNGGSASSTYGYHFSVFDSLYPTLHFASGATAHTKIQGTSALSDGSWYHLAVVVDRDSDANTKVYVNGQAVNTTVSNLNTNTGSISNSVDLTIGSESDGGFYWDGQIDDVRIYNYALTAQQIKNVMNNGALRWGPVTGAP